MSDEYSQGVQDGILAAELVPKPECADVTSRLARSIARAERVRAAVAYLTVEPSLISEGLATTLGRQGSCLCVDIHPPTDLDQLCEFVRGGARIMIHLRQLASNAELNKAGNRGMPNHLMHTKLIVLDFPDEVSEVWIGSHNWTRRALLGPNIEASLILRVERCSNVYADADRMIGYIESISTPFDPTQIDYYRRLQNISDEQIDDVLELEGKDVEDLARTRIQVFGTDERDYAGLKSVRKNLIVCLVDSKTEVEHYYEGEIIQSGLLSSVDPLAEGVSFSSRRYAFRIGRSLPTLLPEHAPGEAVLAAAKYFVVIRLLSKMPSGTSSYDAPHRKCEWRKEYNDPLLMRMNAKDREIVGKNQTITLQTPSFEPSKLQRDTLSDKRLDKKRALISKKIIREGEPDTDELTSR